MIKQFNRNLIFVFLYRLFILFLVYTICRLGFYFFNKDLFPTTSVEGLFYILFGGLRFDFSAICYTNILFIALSIIPFKFLFNKVYQLFLKIIFIVFNFVAIFANCCDIVYYRFIQRRTTFSFFKEFSNDSNFSSLFSSFLIDYWYVTLFFILQIALLIYLYNKIKLKRPNKFKYFYLKQSLIFPILVFFIIIGMRGTIVIPTFPLSLNNASKYVENPNETAIVLNTAFTIIRTVHRKEFEDIKYYKSDTLEIIYSAIIELRNTKPNYKNVIIITLESFSKEFIELGNEKLENGKYKGYAPFFNSLLLKSRTYLNSYSNGRKSIEGLAAILASIPSTQEPYWATSYSTNKILGMASILKGYGYKTAFFHGAPNGSMNLLELAKMGGFEDYYGMTEYGNNSDYDGYWGIWDHKFLPYVEQKISSFKEPFFATIFTISSHSPFKIPADYQNKVIQGNIKLQTAVCYSDIALNEFFTKASKEKWFKNTLFVLVADHSAIGYYKEYNNCLNRFAIPIAFYTPDGSLSGVDYTTVAQQTDIMPTVLNYLGITNSFVSFGSDLFDISSEKLAFNYYQSVYQLIKGEYILQFDGNKTIALYNYKQDPNLSINLINNFSEIRNSMEVKTKAIIQQYNSRVIENRLTIN